MHVYYRTTICAIAERYADQVAAVRKVCVDIPDAEPVILDDLLNERRGWYHDTILCYCADVEPWQWQRIAYYIQEIYLGDGQ